jgi:hypothetical protein
MSEDAEKELASGSIRDESHDDTHHCPASIVHLALLHWREETFTVVVLNHHLWFFGEHIVLTILVGCDSHFTVKKCYYVSIYAFLRFCQGFWTVC